LGWDATRVPPPPAVTLWERGCAHRHRGVTPVCPPATPGHPGLGDAFHCEWGAGG